MSALTGLACHCEYSKQSRTLDCFGLPRNDTQIIATITIPCVYILASKKNGTLYTGVTSDLRKRTYEHKNDMVDGFTKKYQVHLLVYYEVGDSMEGIIMREKQIKAGSRQNKINLIERGNPTWQDLYDAL